LLVDLTAMAVDEEYAAPTTGHMTVNLEWQLDV
jgi:hypothetical protein